MNMANSNYQDSEFEYQVGNTRRGAEEKSASRKRGMSYSRSSRPAVMHNGIHRRRNKRFAW